MECNTITAPSYARSQQLLTKASQIMPLASQPLSDSMAPHFITRGEGAKVWDVDGNEYIDFVNDFGAVILGYCDSDIDAAMGAQLKKGITFSLLHQLEYKVATKLVAMIPCADSVRFVKNSTDVTSAAIRLARWHTKREHIALCGHHDWQDGTMGVASHNQGVPQAVQNLSHSFKYNDIASLEQCFVNYKNQIAAVILEPMSGEFPEDDFLVEVRAVCDEHGAVLIFDEAMTGFRFGLGGASAYFNVTPDLVTLGAGLANGMPLAAIAGKKALMQCFNDVFFSPGFGGEVLSLAAANATLYKLQQLNVPRQLRLKGQYLQTEVAKLIVKHQLTSLIQITGHPALSFLQFKDTDKLSATAMKAYWMQEILARGILSLGTHNLSYAHNIADIDNLLSVYDQVFVLLNQQMAEKGNQEA